VRQYIAAVNNEKAIALLEEALMNHTSEPELHRLSGLAFTNVGHYSNAIKHFKEAVKLEPSHHQTWWNLGNVYEMSGKFQKAKQAYNQAAEVASIADPSKATRYREWSKKVPRSLR
jgi:Flp pilus assembly protein TadD